MKFILVFLFVCTVVLLSGCTTPPAKKWDNDKRADLHVQLGLDYLRRNQLDTSQKELDTALSIDPNHSEANYIAGLLSVRLKKDDLAGKHFKRALQSDPANHAARRDYGAYLCRQGRANEGVTQLETALADQLNPRPDVAAMTAGVCLMDSDLDKAEEYFRQALRKNPGLPPALYNMAKMSYQREEYLSARAFLERFFSVSPGTPGSLFYAVKVERQLGAHDVAQQYAKQLR
ncbi:MAG: type IV pilus biogenesis/stability protein PilW, partial [Gammaproteobacteria bacterium]|nr:type IV pilus biogenesis/stability protein PilW [Gammaproteobacteria bacterium]